MSKKTLNKANLERLGAETLAKLIMDLVQGNAALQRRARLELSAAQGPKDVAADIRKRFASLRRSSSFIDWRKQKAFVKDLAGLLRMIEDTVAPDDADEAFELLWSFLQLAPSIHDRTDDSNGALGGVMDAAVGIIETISPRISMDGKTLADRILDAVAEAGYGEFDGIIPATAEALGEDGLDHLRSITEAWAEAPPTEAEIDACEGFGRMSTAEDIVRRNKHLTRSVILADIADVEGDVDAYMARYSPEQLTFGTIAPGVARRLLDAGRLDEAFEIIEAARRSAKGPELLRNDLDDVYEACLEKQGKTEELKSHLWTRFEETLCVSSLRRYLALLPDFDDMEAEEKAMDYAEAYPDLGTAIGFLVDWPAHERAERVVITRNDELDGNDYHTLTAASDSMGANHPLAATLMRRAMIRDTLDGAKSSRYRHAARHLAECQASGAAIEDHGNVPPHASFVEYLREKHGRKYGFWQLVQQ